MAMGSTVLVLSVLLFCFEIGSCCSESWIDCGNGKCVAHIWRCDGDNNCGNMRDEENCESEIYPRQCLSTQFQCVSSADCIPQKWHCDGERDCEDNSDELNCESKPPHKACLGTQFQCVADGHCIPKTLQCDGKHDCEDKSDEVNCCVQMPEASALLDQNEDLASQVQDLQRNVTELWTYIHTLRNAVTQHLNHLRQHQVELESTCHHTEHAQGGTHASHTDDHHSHSGEHHSHSGEHHSHSGEHHSHSGEHQSHGDDHQHSHSGEHHSHSGGGDHHHDSHSHTSEDSHSSHGDGGHHHGDSHESEDLQQSQQPTTEPLILPSVRQPHSHHRHHHHSHGSSSAAAAAASASDSPMQLMTEQGHHHHHHHGPQPVARNITRAAVALPKYSEYALYDFAVCNVQPNRAIPEEQQQNVMGQVTLFQKKLGGPLNIHVRLQGFAMGGHHGAHQALQTAQVQQLQDPMVEEENEAPPAGHRHGFHIHSSGDLSNGCQSTGPHYNPKAVNHGGPSALVRHVGDLGNIECDDHGIANLLFSDPVASLRGQYSIVGKSMVIHSGQDDYGLGGDEESLRTGNAGTRIACCVIQKVDKIPIRSYKAMKSAIQYQN